ncbi:SDR family oxidoreductase [Sediminibacterium goheungense]|nr:SDR family oxidoreductase [Sediminibacterium goheungense]
MHNKKILVIGGSSGIGKAVAEMAYSMGNHVTLTSRQLPKAIATAKSIGNTVTGLQLDINDETQVEIFFNAIEGFDHIYIAAGSTKIGALTDGLLHQNLQAFHTRLIGSLSVVRAAIHRISSGGSFVFTGGISTDRPIPGAWVSGLGTAAAEQLARVLVMEYPYIRFNAVSPGYTDTPMWDDLLGENRNTILAEVAQKLPVKKIASPQEVASAVLFLMSNASVNGEVLHVDGGGRLV